MYKSSKVEPRYLLTEEEVLNITIKIPTTIRVINIILNFSMLTIIFEPFILSFINNMIKYKNPEERIPEMRP